MDIVVPVIVGIGLVIGALVGAFVLGMRRRSRLVLRPLIALQRRVLNPIQLASAGRPGAYAGIIRHRGRRTGQRHETPVGVVADGDGFLIALPYGVRTQWLRNVLAAGEAELVTEGRTVAVDQPEVIATASVVDRFSAMDRRMFGWFSTTECLRLRERASVAEVSPVPVPVAGT